jgi:hypothetical protein
MTSKYEQVYDDEWWEAGKPTFVACCDCGLVHEVGIRRRKGRYELMFKRDNRRTAAHRRHR